MENQFDAFSAGVEPGGLRNTTEINIDTDKVAVDIVNAINKVLKK